MGQLFVEKQYLLISLLWVLFTVGLQHSRKRLHLKMESSKKRLSLVKAFLGVRQTLKAHESVVMLSSMEPRLRNKLSSAVPRSRAQLFLIPRICLAGTAFPATMTRNSRSSSGMISILGGRKIQKSSNLMTAKPSASLRMNTQPK